MTTNPDGSRTDVVDPYLLAAFEPPPVGSSIVTAAGATNPLSLANRFKKSYLLEDFTTDASGNAVDPSTALLAAIAAGGRHITITESHTWTIPCVLVTPDVTLLFLGPLQTKAFSGDLFTCSGARLRVFNSRWTANGGIYTGNIFSVTNITRGYFEDFWCNDLPDATGYFLEETASGAMSGCHLRGGFLNTFTPGISKAHVKLYGDDTKGPAAGVSSISAEGGNYCLDLGGSREARVTGFQDEWPHTWSNAGGFGTISAHLSNSRFTSQREDNTYTLLGDSHLLTGIATAAAVTIAASRVYASEANAFGSPAILSGSLFAGHAQAFKTGFTIAAGFSGSIDQGQQVKEFTGNADASVVAGLDGPFIRYAGTLSVDRILTLSGGWDGAYFKVHKNGTGANLLISDGSVTLRYLGAGEKGEFRHNGTTWVDVTQGEPRFTFAHLPTASLVTGMVAIVTDVGDGGSRWVSNGLEWKPTAPVTLGHSSGNIDTLSSTEAVMATVTIKAGVPGLTNRIEVDTLWGMTASANTKTMRARHHSAIGVSGAAYISQSSVSTTLCNESRVTIVSDNSASAQVAAPSVFDGGVGNAAAAPTTAVINTANDSYINITGVVAGGETLSLRSYAVRVLP